MQVDSGLQAWRIAADLLPVFMFSARPDGFIDFANEAIYRYVGLERRQEPEQLWNFVHPADVRKLTEVWQRGFATGTRFRCEFRFRSGTGTYRWFVATIVPYVGADGRIDRWFGTTLDVDDQKRAEAAVAESERSFRVLAEAVPVIVWTARADGWIDWYNHRWYQYTGQTREEAAGWGWQAAHHPEDFPRVMQQWPHSIATGEPFEMEFRLRGADGNFRWFLTRILPLRNASGEIVRWYGSNVDIQAQKEELERSTRVAETLQRVFLPEKLPHTQSVRFDAIYVASERDALVGGDWYDAVRLRDGSYLITIGDVVGHGLEASVIAGRLRQAALDFSFTTEDPAQILEGMNRALRFQNESALATALVGIVNPDCETLRYACAGHPPPLVAAPGGNDAQSLPYGGLPLGVSASLEVTVHCVDLKHGTVVAFYTDGLTEFRRDLFEGEELLTRAVANLARHAATARPAQRVRDAVMGNAAPEDDVALLIAQFETIDPADVAGDELSPIKEWRFHSSDAYTAHVSRRELMRFIGTLGSGDDNLFHAELILGEILANTVEHAPGLVEIRVDWTSEKPVVTVWDTGPGLEEFANAVPADAWDENGRGLFLIQALGEDLTIRPAAGYGTELRVVLPVRRKLSSV